MNKQEEYKKSQEYNKKYRSYSFRLNDLTVKNLADIKGDLSWNKFFLAIIREKMGIKCYFCGTHNKLEEHHIIARKDGGTDEPENKMFLCESCHRKTESWGNKKNK